MDYFVLAPKYCASPYCIAPENNIQSQSRLKENVDLVPSNKSPFIFKLVSM